MTEKDLQVCVLSGGRRLPGMEEVERKAVVTYVSDAELQDVLPSSDVLFVWDLASRAFPRAWRPEGRLSWVHTGGAGVDRLLFPEIVDSDVVLTNSPRIYDQAIAEYVLGLILAFAKQLPRTIQLQKQQVWEHRETELLAGGNALIIGTGSIGRAVARALSGLGISVAASGGPPDRRIRISAWCIRTRSLSHS